MSIRIVPLKYEELEKISKGEVLETYDFSKGEISEIQKKAIAIKLDKMKKVEKELHDWFTYWVITLDKSSVVMGLIGFKGFEANGSVEVGYGIHKDFEGKGYTTEALSQLKDWAFGHKYCKSITARGVLKDNYGSQRVLLKNGFEKFNETDEIINYFLLNNR